MATSSVTPTSTANSPFAPVTLNGVSEYSSTLQAVLTRADAIAQIPITNLQNQDAVVLSKESALGSLQTTIGNLASGLSGLASIAANQGLTAASSDSSAVTATITGATAPASYTINSITTAASAAAEVSQNGYADATSTQVSATGSMELVVGANHYDFTLTNNTLTGLEDQINSLNAGVTASILTTANKDYLSVTANSTGATTLQLFDDPTGADNNILTSKNQGTDAVFQLDGIPVDQASNTVNDLIPGVTLNIVGPSSSPVTVSLTNDATQLSGALETFVSDYNAAQTAIAAQQGTSGGPLVGDPTVTQLADTLGQMVSYYNSSGGVNSLSDLGITFNGTTGQATYDGGTALGALTGSQITDAFNFVGSATTGLAAFGTTLQEYSAPVTGLIQTETTGLSQEDQDLQSQITTKTSEANVMQTNLQAQLAAADSSIAELQSQQQVLTGSLQALSLVLYGQNPTQVG